jgi:hypothetical protein
MLVKVKDLWWDPDPNKQLVGRLLIWADPCSTEGNLSVWILSSVKPIHRQNVEAKIADGKKRQQQNIEWDKKLDGKNIER